MKKFAKKIEKAAKTELKKSYKNFEKEVIHKNVPKVLRTTFDSLVGEPIKESIR